MRKFFNTRHVTGDDFNTIANALSQGTRLLSRYRTQSPLLDAEILLAHALGKPRDFILARPETPLEDETSRLYQDTLSRRAQGEPIAYITGHKEFYRLDFLVTPEVLIPRPETEGLVDLVMRYLSSFNAPLPTIIDIGTGSGCIAITLAKNIPQARIIATDVSKKALVIARKNAHNHDVERRIFFLNSDLLSAFLSLSSAEHSYCFAHEDCTRQVVPARSCSRDESRHGWSPADEWSSTEAMLNERSLLIANLPYLTNVQIAENPDLSFEPITALTGGTDGLAVFKKLVDHIKKMPRFPHAIFLEIDPSQKEKLTSLFAPIGQPTFIHDLTGRTRYLVIESL